MHFSVQTTAALVALLSLSGSLAAPVAGAPSSIARLRQKQTRRISRQAPTRLLPQRKARVGTDNPPAAGQPDTSLNLSGDEVAKETESNAESSGGAPPGNDAPSDQSQDTDAPEVESASDTPSDTPTGTDETGGIGPPQPHNDVGDASHGADAGEPVQALGLSSNSVASNVQPKAEKADSNPIGNKKAASSAGRGRTGLEQWLGEAMGPVHQYAGNPGGMNEKGNHPEGINYVPMLHGKAIPGVDDEPALFETNKAKFKDWGVTHILSFNEPDKPIGDVGGSGMTVEEAVALHQKHFTPELSAQYKIGGPAYSQGKLDDLKKWEIQCAGKCPFDFVSLHFYAGAPINDAMKALREYLQSPGRQK
ncbi:hypothetical protein QFC20_003798 [Naganishia adeliensis]|uniref:Uncharacterized protein n=1 Tax=Naganishia adeliensis TaxID=92952 RepID=A0ACC2W6N8_9TREE|nr:hypothetical protein QFC20_003798 [Naganishia adeliensis]